MLRQASPSINSLQKGVKQSDHFKSLRTTCRQTVVLSDDKRAERRISRFSSRGHAKGLQAKKLSGRIYPPANKRDAQGEVSVPGSRWRTTSRMRWEAHSAERASRIGHWSYSRTPFAPVPPRADPRLRRSCGGLRGRRWPMGQRFKFLWQAESNPAAFKRAMKARSGPARRTGFGALKFGAARTAIAAWHGECCGGFPQGLTP